MSEENASAPSPEDAVSPGAPAAEPAPRKGARPLVIAYAALLILLAAGATALNLFGSAEAGDLVVTLKLTPFPDAGVPGEAVGAKSFRDARENGGNLLVGSPPVGDPAPRPPPPLAPPWRNPPQALPRD